MERDSEFFTARICRFFLFLFEYKWQKIFCQSRSSFLEMGMRCPSEKDSPLAFVTDRSSWVEWFLPMRIVLDRRMWSEWRREQQTAITSTCNARTCRRSMEIRSMVMWVDDDHVLLHTSLISSLLARDEGERKVSFRIPRKDDCPKRDPSTDSKDVRGTETENSDQRWFSSRTRTHTNECDGYWQIVAKTNEGFSAWARITQLWRNPSLKMLSRD